MSPRTADDSDWDDEDAGWEDEDATIPCPHCGQEIHEDAPWCPHCDQYVSEEDAPPARKPWWIIIGALLVLYIVYRWNF